MWENYVLNKFLPKSSVSLNQLKLSTWKSKYYMITHLYINMAKKLVSAGILKDFLYDLNMINHLQPKSIPYRQI